MITFAVPFHRRVDLLRRAIGSVAAQTSRDWRLVVCDEGVEEGAADAVAALGDTRARHVRNERQLGLAGNWNRCLEQAGSPLVCLLHADDELLPSYAALMEGAARGDPDATAFFCEAEIVDEQGRRVASLADRAKRWIRPSGGGRVVLEGEDGVQALLRGNFVMCPTLCYRRERLPAAPFAARWSFVPDLDLELRLLLEGHRLVGLADTGYRYRRHEASQTHVLTQGLARFEEEIAFHDEMAARAAAHGFTRAASMARRRPMVRLNLAYRGLRDLAALRTRAGLAKVRLLARDLTARVRPS